MNEATGTMAEMAGDLVLLPLWIQSVLVVLLLPLSAYFGHRVGRRTRAVMLANEVDQNGIVGEATSNAMLAILGLLLAFTFGFALSRSEERRATQIEEVASIGTAFLRADLLPEPGRTALRTSLARYAETRLVEDDVMVSRGRMEAFLRDTGKAQAQLWPTALAAMGPGTPPAIKALVANGVTDVLDAHTRRYSAATQYVPTFAKTMILVVACTALIVASNSSALHGRELTWRTFLFAGLLAVVMIVILDFERPREGLVQIDIAPVRALVSELNAALAAG